MYPLQEAERQRPTGRAIERLVELPIEFAPARQIIGRPGLVYDCIEMGEVGFPHPGDRLAQQPTLELEPKGEELLGFLGGQSRNDGALVRRNGDEAFGLELLQCFAQRDTTDAELLGVLLLADRLAGADLVCGDALLQDLCGFGGDGSAFDRAIHDWNDTTGGVTAAIRLDRA